MNLWIDLSCTQDRVHAERGIPTYTREFARALNRIRPDLVERWVIEESGPVPSSLEFLLSSGKLSRFRSGRFDPAVEHTDPPVLYHDLSPFYAPNGAFLQRLQAAGSHWVSTLYDLIPLIFADRYLVHAEIRAEYMASLTTVQQAEHLMCISEATALDAQRLLGIGADRLTVVGTGVADRFRPAADRDAAFRAAREYVHDLRPGFLMYTGGIDHRKNIDGLIEAYSLIPAALRHEHPLVIVCRVQPAERQHLVALAEGFGVAGDLVLTGYVSDEAMLALYQSAHLFVFPSLYEGFGLPIAEALSCGVPCVVGNNSSLIELMPLAEARFDASEPQDIARAIERGLTDDEWRAEILDAARRDFSWDAVARRAIPVYERWDRPAIVRVPRRRRPRVAFISPMPPAPSGVADYSANTLAELTKSVDVDVFCQAGATRAPQPGLRWFQYRAFSAVEAMEGTYDRVIYAFGNSDHHLPVLDLLRHLRRGTVVAHDVNLQALSGFALSARPDLVGPASEEVLVSQARGALPEVHAGYLSHATPQYYSFNFPLSRQWVSYADEYLVHSEAAKALVTLELTEDQRHKVRVIPFAHPEVRADTVPRDAVVSMGILQGRKNSLLVARAFADLADRHPEVTFALVGEPVFSPEETAAFAELMSDPRLEGRVVVTGRVDRSEYDSWLSRALIAVQLRTDWNGESSASLADAFAGGAAVITSAVGSMAELPGDAVTLVSRDSSLAELIAVIEELLVQGEMRDTQRARASEYARANPFRAAASGLLQGLDSAPRQ